MTDSQANRPRPVPAERSARQSKVNRLTPERQRQYLNHVFVAVDRFHRAVHGSPSGTPQERGD